MSTDLMEILVPCGLVFALYGAGIVTGLVISRANAWVQSLGSAAP